MPQWAILERALFDLLDQGWRLFQEMYTGPDGRLEYRGEMIDRDGVDDFYEPFFNWPTLYRLGGSTEILDAAKLHWNGVTAQLEEFGFVTDEFELGYDWFHQGESLLLFYAICAADPDDDAFRQRALRFAELYLASSGTGNFDATSRMIVAPHTGSGGPRWGLGHEWREYRADQQGMKPYGLPLHDLPGIDEWDDLAVGDNAQRMGDAMQERMGRGDVIVNLAATSLMTNAWLYDNDARFADWVREYVSAWRDRARDNTESDAPGVVPDNVGPSGVVGESHSGRWFGGHYGWTWPHGLHSVESALLVGCIAELIVTGEPAGLELARSPLRAVLRQAIVVDNLSSRGSHGDRWKQKLGVTDTQELMLVPYRRGPQGWFDYHPMPPSYFMWLWWLSGSSEDSEQLTALQDSCGYEWSTVHWFRDKEEAGHEAPWLAYLSGQNSDYPLQALTMALAQVTRRLALMQQTPHGPPGNDIHWWQRLNPVVVEVLLQLTTGSPPALYNGGLQLARVLFGDAEQHRPGLPEGVAALVTSVDVNGIHLSLVNLNVAMTKHLDVQAGAFAEDRIDTVSYDHFDGRYPGSSHQLADLTPSEPVEVFEVVNSSRLAVTLPPLTSIDIRLTITRRAFTPSHSSFSRN
ncbi:hypothetical protein ACWPKO_28550 (plasmid) [Coraliomargarita sp. W4R53]